MKKNKNQTITLDAISNIVREEVGDIKKDIGGMKKDIGDIKKDVGGMKKDISGIKRKVGDIDQRLKDFAQDYTNADLETRVVTIETKLGISVPAEDNGV